MKIRDVLIATGSVVVCGAVAGVWSLCCSEESQRTVVPVSFVSQPGDPQEEMIKNMLKEQAALAPQHKVLEALVGTFNAEMNFLMEPGGEPDKTKGVSVNKSILGGRFVTMEFAGDINMFGDVIKFAGLGMMGFDKSKGEFIMTWADTMSTSLLMQAGKPGTDSKRIEVSGTAASVMGEQQMKHVYIIESNDKHTLEFYQAMPGMDEMMKIGWITYTRKGD